MSTIIREGEVSPEATWPLLADDAPVPAEGRVIVSLARWQQEFAATPLAAALGVKIPNTADVESLWPLLSGAALICLDFPSFGDGRAYSQARLLRDRYGYAGEIRATGAAVVADQIHGMLRCGISSLELRADQDVETCLQAMRGYSAAYQPAADRLTPVSRLRLGAARARHST